VSSYQLPDMKTSGMILPLVGVGAAVAVPAFLTYVKRSKTVEATANVRRLADAAASYAEANAGKKKAKFSFPASTDWTPAKGCCGQPGDRCVPDAAAWAAATWKALGFSVDEGHLYQYRVQSTGKGPKAKLVVEARGDLDCDGKFSSYKREVTVDGQGTASISSLKSSDDVE
jgi:hypothetical protein